MALIVNEIRTRRATCPTHGQVTAEKQVPKLKFPFIITGIARGVAAAHPYRCPTCGTRTSAAG
jgi:hypothetical protein